MAPAACDRFGRGTGRVAVCLSLGSLSARQRIRFVCLDRFFSISASAAHTAPRAPGTAPRCRARSLCRLSFPLRVRLLLRSASCCNEERSLADITHRNCMLSLWHSRVAYLLVWPCRRRPLESIHVVHARGAVLTVPTHGSHSAISLIVPASIVHHLYLSVAWSHMPRTFDAAVHRAPRRLRACCPRRRRRSCRGRACR